MKIRSCQKDREDWWVVVNPRGIANGRISGTMYTRHWKTKVPEVVRDKFDVKVTNGKFAVDVGTGSGVKVMFALPKARKKRATRYLHGCPKCGGHWTKVSGLYRCQSCGHVYGSQNPSLAGSPNVALTGRTGRMFDTEGSSGARSGVKRSGG